MDLPVWGVCPSNAGKPGKIIINRMCCLCIYFCWISSTKGQKPCCVISINVHIAPLYLHSFMFSFPVTLWTLLTLRDKPSWISSHVYIAKDIWEIAIPPHTHSHTQILSTPSFSLKHRRRTAILYEHNCPSLSAAFPNFWGYHKMDPEQRSERTSTATPQHELSLIL